MKTFKLFFIIFGLNLFSIHTFFAQETIELEFDTENEHIYTYEKEMYKRTPYVFKIDNLNTAYLDVVIETEGKKLITPIPEVLKPIFPNISFAGALNIESLSKALFKVDSVSYGIDFQSIVGEYVTRLDFVKSKTRALYTAVKSSDKTKQDSILDSIVKKYNNVSDLKKDFETFKNAVLIDAYFIQNTQKMFEIKMSKIGYDPNEDVEAFVVLKAVIDNYAAQYLISEYQHYLKFIARVINDKDEGYISPRTYILKDDVLETSIKIIDVFKKDTIDVKDFDFYAKKRGWHFNFSSGFIGNSITEEKYFLSPRDTLISSVIREDTNSFDVSIGALGHLNYSFSSSLSAGFSLGLAVSPFDSQTRYLLGGNVLLGRKNQIGINVGAALARVDKLSGTIQSDDQGLFLPAGESISTFKKIEWGYFIGITYNVFQQKK